MSWFTELCRNVGLMIHNIRSPEGRAERRTVNRKVEERQVDATTTLRRTTIEEIEIKHPKQ